MAGVMGGFVIRVANKEELKYPVEWAAREGWNPGLYDIEAFYYADPKGYLLGFLGEEPIGSISAVSYGDFGFMGFYIVKPEYRGRGYGIRLWNEATSYLEGKNVGLDGVVAQQENYKKSGFKLAYRNIRFQGKGTGSKKNSSRLVEIDKLPFGRVAEFDEKHFPASRAEFLVRWLRQPDSLSLAVMEKDQIRGYGMIRLCREGFKIGPLFALDLKSAEELLDSLLGYAPRNANVYFDVPEPNKEALALTEKYGMKKVFETARMYTMGVPNINLNHVYGVTTFELG